MAAKRAFLKWAGSKYNCINRIISALPVGKRLIEPFTGSAVVFLNTNYSRYLLGEHNNDLINLFNHLRQQGHDFINYCSQFFNGQYNNKEHYYAIRKEFNSLEHSELKSAYFLYLNRHGYNGLCRYNSQGIYNVLLVFTKNHISHMKK